MSTEILFQTHLVLGYVAWLLCFGVYIWPWLKSTDPVEAQGAIRLPWGKQSTAFPLVSAEDVARIATGLLTSPALTAGAAYPVIGAAISLNEIIATFRRVLNKELHYEEITDEQWRSEALARGSNAHAVETPVLALEGSARRKSFSGGRAVCGDGYDRKRRRHKAKDLRSVRARAAKRIGHPAVSGCVASA